MELVIPRTLLNWYESLSQSVSPGSLDALNLYSYIDMSTPTTPTVPTLAQLISQMLVPCLSHILASSAGMLTHASEFDPASLPSVSEKQLQVSESLWQELWPEISRDYETVTAVQKVACTPDSPVWQSVFEQGLISILSRNDVLARILASKLREM